MVGHIQFNLHDERDLACQIAWLQVFVKGTRNIIKTSQIEISKIEAHSPAPLRDKLLRAMGTNEDIRPFVYSSTFMRSTRTCEPL